MTAALAPRTTRPLPLPGHRPAPTAVPARFRPVVAAPVARGSEGSARCRTRVAPAVPRLGELLVGLLVVVVAVVGLRLAAPSSASVAPTTTANGELVITVAEGETLDDVLERVADGPARIDLGEQIVRLNGGRDLQAGRQFVVRVG